MTTGGTNGAGAPQAGPAATMANPSPTNVSEDLDVRNISLHPYKVVTQFTSWLTYLCFLISLSFFFHANGLLTER